MVNVFFPTTLIKLCNFYWFLICILKFYTSWDTFFFILPHSFRHWCPLSRASIGIRRCVECNCMNLYFNEINTFSFFFLSTDKAPRHIRGTNEGHIWAESLRTKKDKYTGEKPIPKPEKISVQIPRKEQKRSSNTQLATIFFKTFSLVIAKKSSS